MEFFVITFKYKMCFIAVMCFFTIFEFTKLLKWQITQKIELHFSKKKNQFGIQVVVRKLTYLRTLSLFSIMLSMCTCIEITQPNFISILQYIVLLYYKVSDLNIIAILYCILLAACLSVYIYVCLSKCFRHIF